MKIRICFVPAIMALLFSMLVSFSSQAYARHWQWIESNDYYGYFVDTESIKPNVDGAGQFNSANLWLKVQYSEQGLRNDWENKLEPWMNVSELLKGSTMINMDIDFFSGEISVYSRDFVDQEGNVRFHSKYFKTNVDRHVFYAPVFAYVEDYLTGDGCYNHLKNGGIIPITGSKDLGLYYMAWRTRYSKKINDLIVPEYVFRKFPTGTSEIVYYLTPDFKGQAMQSAWAEFKPEGGAWHKDDKYSEPKSIVPGSVGEVAFMKLKDYIDNSTY